MCPPPLFFFFCFVLHTQHCDTVRMQQPQESVQNWPAAALYQRIIPMTISEWNITKRAHGPGQFSTRSRRRRIACSFIRSGHPGPSSLLHFFLVLTLGIILLLCSKLLICGSYSSPLLPFLPGCHSCFHFHSRLDVDFNRVCSTEALETKLKKPESFVLIDVRCFSLLHAPGLCVHVSCL